MTVTCKPLVKGKVTVNDRNPKPRSYGAYYVSVLPLPAYPLCLPAYGQGEGPKRRPSPTYRHAATETPRPIEGARKEKKMKKEICKNCENCKPTYKGGMCEITKKKVNMSKGTCEKWREKK